MHANIRQCDPHRRALDEKAAQAQIKRDGERAANRQEWCLRAADAILAGDFDLARNLIAQAELA